MTHKPGDMSCDDFQDQLADLIASGEDISNHPHLKNCPRCRALLADLQTIADAARQLIPVDPPEDDLWDRIESAIRKEENSSTKS